MEIGAFALLLFSTPLISQSKKGGSIITEDTESSKFIKGCEKLLPTRKKIEQSFSYGVCFLLAGLALQLDAVQNLYCQFLTC